MRKNDTNVNEIIKALLPKVVPLIEAAARECATLGEDRARREIMQRLQGGGAALVAKPVAAKKQVVVCPVPNCKRPGIKPHHCFCQHHYDTIAPAEREKLRAHQIEERKQQAMH